MQRLAHTHGCDSARRQRIQEINPHISRIRGARWRLLALEQKMLDAATAATTCARSQCSTGRLHARSESVKNVSPTIALESVEAGLAEGSNAGDASVCELSEQRWGMSCLKWRRMK
jgi:hypothetical protein